MLDKPGDIPTLPRQRLSSSHRLLFHYELFRSHYVFVQNVLITGYLHISFCSTGCGNLFLSGRASDYIHQHTSYLCPLPNGAPAGCCSFLCHLCWHGERQLRGLRVLLSLQNRKNTLLSNGHMRQKTS